MLHFFLCENHGSLDGWPMQSADPETTYDLTGINDMKKEFVTHEAGNDEARVCICGNTPSDDGFHTCDAEGNEIHPTVESGWKSLYVCLCCGRIIYQDPLKVVGRNPEPKLMA